MSDKNQTRKRNKTNLNPALRPKRAAAKPKPDETFKPVETNREDLRPKTSLSGDLSGLPEVSMADSESVEELAEGGQAYEAEVVLGVEDAFQPDEDEAEPPYYRGEKYR